MFTIARFVGNYWLVRDSVRRKHLAKILVIEDDLVLADSLSDWLENNGHQSEVCHDGTDGLLFLQQRGFDLAIVDWQLPGLSGPSICKHYRQSGGKTPILMLTEKSSIDEKEEGLDSGADDYLSKPFEVRELAARVRALLRRSAGLFESNQTIGKIKLDTALCRVTISDKEIQLVPREFKLFEFLLRHPQAYFTADKLIDHVWESSIDVGQQALRVCINRIRTKLDDPSRPSVIENSKGWGYKISDWYLND